jgi:hypothetical protein
VPSVASAGRTKGDGGGLRDFERLASSCKKGIGENIGVGGADESMALSKGIEEVVVCGPSFLGLGNASEVDVTSNDFSTARRYLPIIL